MAHRALALKYRPQVFSDLVGQDHVTMVLARSVEGGRAAHAYLFAGARGVGKTTTARILAKALNCERRAAGEIKGADPCNACTSCTEITSGVSLDVAEIDGASNRGIADVQALREKVRFTPTGGRYRVVIIDEVHQLSNDAFAALLKTLEEPPAHLVFIFATTDPQKLPDTIRSRTQRFDFARVPLRKVAERLHEIARREAEDAEGVKFKLDEGAALLIAHKSEGSVRDAVSALDQVISAGETKLTEEVVRRVLGIADREAFFTLAEAIVRRDPPSALKALHAAFEKGLDPRDLAEGLAEHIRHLLVLKVDPNAEDLVVASAEDLKRLRAQCEAWSEGDLLRLLKLASEVTVPMKDSPQPLIHVEAAVVQMATLESGETLAQILERLESLERRLKGGPEASTGPTGGASRGQPSRSAGTGSPPDRSATPAGVPVRSMQGGGVVAATSPVPATSVMPAMSATPVMSATPSMSVMAGSATATLENEPVSDAIQSVDPSIEARWQSVLEAVNARKRMLGAFLQECQFRGAIDSDLVLAMDDLHRAVIDEAENRSVVAAEVARVFGRTLAVRCVPIDQAAAPRRATEQDVRPMIERTIAWFEGDIIERNKAAERTNR